MKYTNKNKDRAVEALYCPQLLFALFVCPVQTLSFHCEQFKGC